MAAPLELSCWGGGWGLPSVHSESLVVMVRPPCGPGRRKDGRGQRREADWVWSPSLAAVPCGAAGPRVAGELLAALHWVPYSGVTAWPVTPPRPRGRVMAFSFGSESFQPCRAFWAVEWKAKAGCTRAQLCIPQTFGGTESPKLGQLTRGSSARQPEREGHSPRVRRFCLRGTRL